MKTRGSIHGKLAMLALFALPGLVQPVLAQSKPEIVGDYLGEIGPQQANLHLKIDDKGELAGTLDHLDPSAPWMFVLANVRWDGRNLSFSVASADASWSGGLTKDGSTLSGTWTQKGGSWLVDFVRQKFVPAVRPSAVDGIWLGEIVDARTTSTRVQVVVKSDIAGREFCTVDFLDVYYTDLQCRNVVLQGDGFSFDIPAMAEHWGGKISADGKSLTGSLSAREIVGKSTQPIAITMNFTRQSALSAEKPRQVATYDAALPAVTADELEEVLSRDMAAALKSGALAPESGGGVTIGVYEHGVRRIFSFGSAKVDSIFEIGSITKTFTGLMLAQMATQGKVRLDEPVRELLPAGTVTKPEGREITLLDLATRRSGLPAMPENLNLANMDQPFADYHAADLYAYLGKHGVANPTQASSSFGALGFGMLGVALADRAGETYEALLRDEVAGPLGLKDTEITLSEEQMPRFTQGHDEFHQPARAWDSDALAGAIGIRSTAGDLLAYLEANLHPESVKPAAGFAGSAMLSAALRLSHQPQAEDSGGMRIALGWLYQPETGNFWHNGATAAHSSYAFFNPKGDYAAVVLYNTSPGGNGSFVEILGRHVSQRLTGKPAVSLSGTIPF